MVYVLVELPKRRTAMGTTDQLSQHPFQLPGGVPTPAARAREKNVAFPIISLPLGFVNLMHSGQT